MRLRVVLAVAVAAVGPALGRDDTERLSVAYPVTAGLKEACFDGLRRAILESGDGSLRQILREALEPDSEQCPAGWTHHLDSCYLIPHQKNDWRHAHHLCATLDRRARLASVHHSSSHFIETLAEEFGAEKGVWVGLSRPELSSAWLWSDGSGTDYLNWDEAQPTDQEDELCAHLGWTAASSNHLHDNYCSYAMNVLCQIDLK